MDDLPLRLLPGVTLPEGLDERVLVRVIGGVVRAAHPRRPPDPHEGEVIEETCVRSITRRGGWHVRFGYHRNAHARSRSAVRAP